MTDLEFVNTGLINKGERITGYFIPPRTGTYRFFVSCDDQAEVYLNSDALDANP